MPYKRIGRTVYTKSGGTWHKKQTCGTIADAERAMRLLQGVEHGDWKPTGKKAQK